MSTPPPPKHPWIQAYEDWKASPDNETFARIQQWRRDTCEHHTRMLWTEGDVRRARCFYCWMDLE